MSDDVILNTKKLDAMIKALKQKLPTIQIGVLGGKVTRKGFDHSNNASIGAIHEFGDPQHNIPVRSFLRMPIADNLEKDMESSDMFGVEEMNKVFKESSIDPWLKRIAVLAEGIVAKAFATGGFGKWPAWKNPNYKNGDMRLLVDTGQLRDSISTRIV